jgi:hypothetical protein
MAEEKKAPQQATQPTAPRTVHRSPNYPMFSLKDAIDKVRLVYQHEKRNFTTSAVIQKDIGYKEGTGPAGRAVSALKQYGLLEERSGTYGLSDKGFLFTYADESSPERVSALRDAALKPLIFKELIDLYPSGLPSDATLRAHLVGKKGFNPSTVDDFIRIFKETVSLAKVVPGEYDPSQPGDESGGRDDVELPIGQGSSSGQSGKSGAGIHTFVWSLSFPRNVRAELKLFGNDVRIDDIRRLKKQIESIEESFQDSEGVS